MTYDRLREDSKRILTTGFTLAVVFTSPTGIEYPTTGFFSDIGMTLDANGMPTQGRRVTLTVSTTSADGTPIFTESAWPKNSDWRVSFTYNGASFYGEVINSMFDRVMGCITLNAGKVRTA